MMPRLKLRTLLLLWSIGACSLLSLAQSVTVNPTSVSFSNQAQGTTSAVRKVTLKNGQTSSITITSITSSLSDFAQTNTCPVSPATLAAGASCTISVTFTPSAQGSRSGTLTVTDSGLSSPQLVTLTGTGTAATLKSIAVTPSTATVIAALTQQYTASGTYSDGSTQNLTTTASWTSSSTATATIGLHTGLAKGVVAGTATITASSGTIKGTATLTVTSAVLTSISVTPATASIAAGKTKQFTATGTYNNGTSQNITSSVSWTSSAISFATVSAAGLATGVAQGSASITATSGTISGSATLTVTAPSLSSIAVTPSTASIGVAATQSFTATGTYSDGSTKTLTTSASWTSSLTSVATVVLHTGLATGVSAGTTTITATSGAIKGTATLTVSPVLTSIAVSPANPTIAKGNNQQFSATGTFSDGSTQDLTSTATWTSSQTAVATIAAGGLATSTGTGTATITAASGSISGSTTIAVNPALLVSIAVKPANSSFALGTTLSFTATGTYSDGSTLDLTTSVTWSTPDSTVATMNAQGVASSVGLGSTTVTATLGSIAGSTGVTVTPAVLSSIAVTPAIPSIAAGVTQQFTATGTFTDGSTQNITATVAWSSDTPSVATISNAAGTVGLATAVAPGQATIAASSGSINGSTTLTVTPVVLMSIAVTPPNPSIAAGTTQQFTATGTFSDGTTQNLTVTATWESDTPATATIIAGGLSTGVAQGAATISATSGSVSGSTVLTVTNATVVSIAINPSTAIIPLGTTQQFTATGTYNDGTTQDLTQTGQWTSTVATVATISDTPGTMGLATSLGVGPTTISLASGNVTGSAALVVNPAALASIAIAPQNSSINLGAQQQFTATGTFTDGTTQDLTSSATWSSSDATIAIIGNSVGTGGLATSAGKGTVTITATSGLISSSTTLTVTGTQLLSISVTPDNSSLLAGATQQMTATGNYSDGSSQDLTTQVVWSSSSSGIASISSTGLATGTFAGTTSISATLNSISGATSLTVTPIVLPLGTVSQIGPVTCPSPGAPKTATCTLVTVSCAGLPDLNATIVLTQPVGVPRGTVILHKGGAGTLLLDNGFPNAYVADGFTSVQIAWAADWVEAKGAGAKSAACRVATLFDYIFTTIHLSNRNAGFCGQGSSGGSATLAYALAHYGMDAYFDHTVMAAGPALSRMDYGCDPSLYQGPPLNLCSSLTNAPYAYTTAALTMFNNWEKTTSCGSANPLPSDISKWVSDSIVTSGGKYTYPQTSMSWFTCTTPPVNESTGEGKFLVDQVVPLGSTASVNCYSGVCKGEGVWGDPIAFNDTVSDMLTKCVPNHQSEAGVASHR